MVRNGRSDVIIASSREQGKITAIDNIIAGIEPEKTLALLLCMVIIPCVLMLLSYFLYKKHYRLDEDEYERICGEIAARKGETI